MKIKKIEVVPYDAEWPEIYQKEISLIQDALKKHCLQTYHIGSTSIEGMSAKPSIDIICVVDALEKSLVLQKIGYIYKDELNIPLRFYFSKNTSFSKVNLHVVEKDHGFININLCFRDYLREHPAEKERYIGLKKKLLKDPKSHEKDGRVFSNYNLGKDTFIKEILEKAAYEGLNLNFCMHQKEWSEYHRIRKQQIFDPIEIEYDQNHPTLSSANHFHFVLYKGSQIVSCAHVELLNGNEAALRTLSTDEKEKRKGYGALLVHCLEKWIKSQKRGVIKLHANTPQLSFYKGIGYQEMLFDDPCIHNDYVDLGKVI